MSSCGRSAHNLRCRIHDLETELERLRGQLLETETTKSTTNPLSNSTSPTNGWGWPLQQDEYQRYGRQMIMHQVGLNGQLNLRNASALIVGMGGLGCPAAAYLAGAGVGTLGLVDGDTVEVSNLHRQILHTTDRVGILKVESAVTYLRQLNPQVCYNTHPAHLTSSTALDIFDKYDIILDCTDHASSRYLVSDAAVLAGKPLVSASALRTEGQLLVLNNPPTANNQGDGGFCYRCVFPKSPPAHGVLSCGEGGILGPVVGVMGVMMAVEALKLLIPGIQLDGPAIDEVKPDQRHPSLLLYSAYGSPPFRSIRLRGKRAHCPSCSESATITRESLSSGSLDYATFCGITHPVRLLDDKHRISAERYKRIQEDRFTEHQLIDVRDKTQFDLCHIDNSINIPISDIMAATEADLDSLGILPSAEPIYCICRHGNDSQLAVQKLQSLGLAGVVKGDIKGGLAAWRKDVDPTFPEY